MKNLKYIFLILTIIILFNNQEAFAYINPGSGSYIFQTVIGGILGIFYFFKNLFLKLFKKDEKNNKE